MMPIKSADNFTSAAVSPPPPHGPAIGLILHSRELFRQGAVVQIRHQGQTYQLRLTRQDRLILTK
ncbi:hemin uptake protein hemP [mine drainage metagenome]|uniref:Hemin uptake protein hemP n=1 Tax=mine drainage metagenome TaxID=410659 RepID=A0A1J5QQC4_9ZZZZ